MQTRIVLVIFICSILFSCKSTMKNTTENIHRKWMLIKFENFSKEELISKKCFLDLTDEVNALAKMGCNTIGFQYEFKEINKIVLSKVRTTEMFCEDHQIESRFLIFLKTIGTYEIKEHRLYLKTESNEELVFVAEDWD